VNGDGLLSLLVALGGGQQRSAVACALEGIRLSGLDLDVHVIGSDGAPASDLIGAARLTRHQATSAIHELMVSCDAAIGAGGGSSWERCCLGLPTLVVVVAENQSENAAAIERAGAGEQLGRSADVDPQSIAKALKALAGNPARLRKMALSAAQLCDGHGAQRVVGELDPRLAQSGEAVILRPVAPSDAEQMFAWQQGPAVRRYAHNPLPPTWEEHVDWLSRRLSTPTSGAVSIIELNGRPAGVLRMDPVSAADWDLPIETPAFLVSILVDPSRQGNGVGLAALAAARDLIPYATLCAEVLPANDASHRLFRRAGYREHSTGRYRLAPPDRPA
jgi:RimJ/RimL family protein N-acetyltransferase